MTLEIENANGNGSERLQVSTFYLGKYKLIICYFN